MHRFPAAAVVACVVVVVVGCASKSSQPTEAPVQASVQPLDEKATAVRLQLTVYEMRVPPERVGQLDAARLARLDFAKLPADLGEARALYLVDQQVSLTGDHLMVGSQEPMITNTRMTDRGQKINTVQYNQVGAVIDFKGERVGPRELQVTSTIDVAAKTDSAVEVSQGLNTAVIRKATMSLKGPVELGRPSVLISADASSRDKNGQALVYVARLVLGASSSGAK